MPGLELALTWEQFARLPRNAAYRYEFLEGQAYLTPRPKHYHARLELAARKVEAPAGCADVVVRPVGAGEPAALVPLFAAAFSTMQPFGSLDESTRRDAARTVLERTRLGGDGPWIVPASFVAERAGDPVGAILITLLPGGNPEEHDCYYWHEPPPGDVLERRLGIPHLTWIFVAPLSAGRGVGTLLLGHVANRLLELGYRQLLSTFLLGNDSSMLWHWRNGFQLLSYPGSARQNRRRARSSASRAAEYQD
uniref:Acetyltransferase n=1 Tax=uncultured Acidobacteria bacterium A2 TaxID=1036852 RepID=F8TTG5_9BACT|nr:acetyltransferase [uncultured Acidobacteria bacterium A2]